MPKATESAITSPARCLRIISTDLPHVGHAVMRLTGSNPVRLQCGHFIGCLTIALSRATQRASRAETRRLERRVGRHVRDHALRNGRTFALAAGVMSFSDARRRN